MMENEEAPQSAPEEQVPPSAVQNRNQAFGQGLLHGAESPSPSLQAEADRFNASVPQHYKPSGSGNGMSQGQYQTTLGGAFANPNGSALDTYATKKFFEQPPE